MNNKVSLVTGGAGFIGSHVVDTLIAKGHKVIVLDDLSGGFTQNVNPKAIWVQGSILNESLLDSLFIEHGIQYIFHLAAYAAEGLSHFIRKFNYENNLIGSINLINRAVKYECKHLVFTSSIAVYGANQVPMTEAMKPEPEDPYGISKYAVEMDLKAAEKMFGLPYTIFRPHNVYGERQNYGDTYRNVIGIFINNMMQGKPMTIFGDGKQKRAFSYIQDVAPYIAEAIDTPKAKNETFNVGADTSHTVLDIASLVAKGLDKEPKITYLPARKEVVDAFSDHRKLKQVFSTTPEVSLEIGLQKMIEWCVAVGPRVTKKFTGIEVDKNMPPSWKALT